MLPSILRAVSLLCAALVFGLTLTHDLEIPGKQLLSGGEWLAVQHTFYGGFAVVGGLSEVLGLLSSGALAYLSRKRRVSFALSLAAALCFAGTLAAFAFGNSPLNQQIASWTPETLPSNWREVRDAWDRYHALSSLLGGVALIGLVVEALRDRGERTRQAVVSKVGGAQQLSAKGTRGAA